MTVPRGHTNSQEIHTPRQYGAYVAEPIAVVGMACRFPGADGLEAFWNLLEAGESAVREGDPGSGAGRLGEIFGDGGARNEASRFAAFIDDIDQFDPSFFRISPLEAQYLDPQQRLMLEMSWKALEDAGIDPDELRGSRTGVYGGITHSDYKELSGGIGNIGSPASSLYAATGTSNSTAIGRVSYALGLQGPAISVDTACSSSLVAVHQAISGLRQDEADLALAGGVSLILSNDVMESRANAGMLSPDGLCKTFDASANGYVRGEGCGVLALKRLRDAEADGDRIWGVIRGSAVNQDGASMGLTVPSGEAQELVIRDALRRSGVSPSEVDYVEAHGTGTSVGDPLELQALASVFGEERESDNPLFIGSVKTNFGHLESASGIAALMKALVSMNHGLIPKHLNFRDPSPAIDWERLSVRVSSAATAWPESDGRPRLAGVSGYGWSGTNAHIVVEGYGEPRAASAEPYGRRLPTGAPRHIAVSLPDSVAETPQAEETDPRAARLLPLSGKTEQALKDLAAHYQTWLDERAEDLESSESDRGGLLSDMAWTASAGRSRFAHRAGIVFRDAESLREGLKAVEESGKGAETNATASKVAFAYTGQGSQWVGMGKTLYDTEPVVRAVLDRCERVILEERGKSLLDVMFGREGADGDLRDTAWTQPAIFALECALTALWESAGVKPDVVIGHSFGELAAAQAAGVFGLEEGLKFVLKRGEALASVPELGSMAAIFASEEQVSAAIEEYNATSDCADLSISVYNGFQQVISGPTEAVESVAKRFESEDVRARILNTGQAFHCVLVEPALDEVENAYEGVSVSPPGIAMVSDVTGRVMEEGEIPDGRYWRRHARQAVQFRKGIGALAELGVDVAIEVGPNAVLGPLLSLVWPGSADISDAGEAPIVLQSMIRPWDDIPTPESEDVFLNAVAGAYEAGLPISFAGLFAGEERRKIELPGYPFQRERYWVDGARRRSVADGHPLLGARHESPRGEVMFENEMFASDPPWLTDHQVFGRVIMPGAMYGAIAAAVSLKEGAGGSVDVEDLQLHSPLVFGQESAEDDGRRIQAVLDSAESEEPRKLEIFSRGESEEGWTLHAEARLSFGTQTRGSANRIEVDSIKSGLSPQDVSGFYRARADANINLGPSFRTLQALWAAGGEAVGEIALREVGDQSGGDLHPTLLDGCFQVLSAARHSAEVESGATYLPFGWERLWFTGNPPERLICHARLRDESQDGEVSDDSADAREVLVGDLTLYTPDGVEVGGLSGYVVKLATRATLLSASEGIEDLFYETVWRDRPLAEGMPSADFLTSPMSVSDASTPFTRYLADEGVEADERAGLLDDLERLSWSYALLALRNLGWIPKAGEYVEPEKLRKRFNVLDEHSRVFRRIFELLARAGVADEVGDGFVIKVGQDDPLPEGMPADVDEFAERMGARYWHGSNEIGLFRRCASALADTLIGQADPLTMLFSSGEPTAADLYMKAPVARAANRMLGDAVAALLKDLPEGRSLRVLEIGAGTGSATAAALPELPAGRFKYIYTDISAGFFSEAEERFGGGDGSIEYRVLDIEKSPVDQGFDSHGYDLVIASNVLHATRYLNETLAHCRELLAPSGQLVALENLRGQGWLDLTFGQLDGWWRFADHYRPHHALASPDIWARALDDAEFGEIEVLGMDDADSARMPDRGVIIARGPVNVLEPEGVWVLAGDRQGVSEDLATELSARNQTVVLADSEANVSGEAAELAPGTVTRKFVEMGSRESWGSLFESLPENAPLSGVVHLAALDGHGHNATAEELGEDARATGGGALALTQAMLDADATPANGTWFITRGGQVLERERLGELSGAILWGFGKVAAREAPHLKPRMIDLDPLETVPPGELVNELMYPDAETHIAYRLGLRQAARLVRAGSSTERLTLPEESRWLMQPDESGSLENLQVLDLPERPLDPKEVRVAVEAAGLNFSDVLLAIRVMEEGYLGGEICGRVLEIGAEVSGVSVGDRVVALGFDTFGSEAVVREEMVAVAPSDLSAAGLATMPTVFVSAALSFDLAGLKAGERVLIHAGSGGVGLAAIQLARAAGAEVFATASAPKQAYLRSLGIKRVFDSRRTKFGRQILEATGGEGVHVVLNSLTGEGFIEASLSCLAQGGRFIELARRDIYTKEEMADARPDVDYHVVEVDVLKEHSPERPGASLKSVMKEARAGELKPLTHTRWSMTEAIPAMKFMRDARHIGKIVLTNSPLETGRLREDRSYLITGGLGGIGCALAVQLADWGAGAIALNGRRAPDPEAEETIGALRERGVTVSVEIADVTDTEAVDAMLVRIDETLPPLGGVIHSVGVLSDAALTNQSWDSFEQVLWPKMLGAWRLHRATMDLDLDMFVLFSSAAGTMGNPGQANHAAANAFLDQLAAHRRALGLPGQTIAWGAWSELGEAAEQRERIEGRLEAGGTGWITPQQGLKAFETQLRQDATASMVASVDWRTYAERQNDTPPFLDEVLSEYTGDAEETTQSSDDLLSQLRMTRRADSGSILVPFLQEELQAVMRLPSLPSPSVGFFDLGMDSLMAVEFRNRLNRAFEGEYTVSNTAVFDYPDVTSLSRHIAEELSQLDIGGEPATTPEIVAPDPLPAAGVEDDGIAIVGMACRFPGAKSLSEYWDLLVSGVDAVSDGRPGLGIPGSDAGDENAAYLRGGFVEDIEWFDSRFFRIAPIEARIMDPQQRMMLETSWEALEDAGIAPEALRGSLTGVFAGVGGSEYRDLMKTRRPGSYLGTAGSVTVGRVAFALGLEGPALPIDMACASSLVAIHQAVGSLRRGEVNLALAGGVHAALSRQIADFMAELGMLSRSGQCSPFDASADGFARGEGCGMIVLKRLSEAEADGDRIWGVIRGSAVNQNGASAGLTVPNGSAEERVMEAALAQTPFEGSDIDYLEAHATGSQLGDAIEMRAVGAVYGKGREADNPLLVGSVKSNIGHLEPAAGIAGVLKTALAMKRRVIPKHLHFENPNPQIDWDQFPVRVTSTQTEWPPHPQRPPRAAVSAFGISGANAHVILEGYENPQDSYDDGAGIGSLAGSPQKIAAPPPESLGDMRDGGTELAEREARLLPLSGKSEGAVRDLAKRYLSWLDERADAVSPESGARPILADMAWTAGIGRSHFAHRAGLPFRDVRSLRDALRTLAEADIDADAPSPQPATGVAFLYPGEASQWAAGMGRELYDTEPTARAILDFCDSVARQARGASLLDAMFGQDGALDDPAWAQPAIYALESAITALWSDIGIRPDAVLGHGPGEISAARASGVFSLGDGMRLSLARGEQANEAAPPEARDSALANLGADVIIEIGPGFVKAVAKAYEAGLTISFEGMFTGETRRRISLPTYPFQRRRHWI